MLALRLACGGWIAAAVGAAARLGLADLLAEGPRTSGELARATGTSEEVLDRVLTLLAGVGLFVRTGDGRFENGPESRLLRSDHPASVRSFCMLAAGEYQQAFHHLMHSLRTGEPAFHEAFGTTLYGYLERTPEAAETYEEAMNELARPVGAAVVERCDLSGVETVVDVGGNRGTLLEAILKELPGARGICVDRADVCRRAEEALASSGGAVAARIRFEPGDFFSEVPPGADLYLLKNVLHNWSDESGARILKTIRKAMAERPGARLFVIEPLSDGGEPTVYQAMDQLLQAVVCEEGSRARSLAEMTELLRSCSLEVTDTVELATGHTVTAAVPAGSA